MNYAVITNRPDAMALCGRLLQRYFGGEGERFPEEVKELTPSLRRRANRAVEAFRKHMQSPDRHSRDRVNKFANWLRDAAEDGGNGVLQFLLASCECAISPHWQQSMVKACETAIGMLHDKYGPASADGMELQCQALDLVEFTGCRLRDVVSMEVDDVEELEGFLEMEAEAELSGGRGTL
jgi:hypothetical protein